jgi:hypothetical protein
MIPEMKLLINSVLDDLESEKNESVRKDQIADLRLLIEGDPVLIISVLKEKLKKTREERNFLFKEVSRLKKTAGDVSPVLFVHEIINGC